MDFYLNTLNDAIKRSDNYGKQLASSYLLNIEYHTELSMLSDMKKIAYCAAYEKEKTQLYTIVFSKLPKGNILYREICQGKYINKEDLILQILWNSCGKEGKVPTSEELKEKYFGGVKKM